MFTVDTTTEVQDLPSGTIIDAKSPPTIGRCLQIKVSGTPPDSGPKFGYMSGSHFSKRALLNLENKVWILGAILYTDADGAPHRTAYCFAFDGDRLDKSVSPHCNERT
jgi:hypothetical protein